MVIKCLSHTKKCKDDSAYFIEINKYKKQCKNIKFSLTTPIVSDQSFLWFFMPLSSLWQNYLVM